jgi:hypothetical protein
MKLILRYWTMGWNIKPRTSWTQSRSGNHLTMTFGWEIYVTSLLVNLWGVFILTFTNTYIKTCMGADTEQFSKHGCMTTSNYELISAHKCSRFRQSDFCEMNLYDLQTTYHSNGSRTEDAQGDSNLTLVSNHAIYCMSLASWSCNLKHSFLQRRMCLRREMRYKS